MAALALFTGLVIIVIRQIVVVLLAILAPIALVLYILPGTEKAWKMWWNSFWGALIMFPLIEAFIAAYNPKANPFKWRKREVKGSQLRNTIVNLCN